MKITISKYLLWSLPMILAFTGCKEDDYTLYDTTQKDSVFFEYRNAQNEITTEVTYNFDYDIASVHTIKLPVILMGVPKDYDRQIRLEVVEDESTMKEGVHYNIENAKIPANAVNGEILINLLRDNDPAIMEKTFSLTLTISESDDLRSVGKNSFTVTYSDIGPSIRPEWWSTNKPMPVYSYENAQLFFEYFYRYAPEANIDLFNEMIEIYGDYFMHAEFIGGPLALYEDFLRNYVCIPLYNEHPEIDWQRSPIW